MFHIGVIKGEAEAKKDASGLYNSCFDAALLHWLWTGCTLHDEVIQLCARPA